ncbi:serine hydrolase [Sphingosinithalassobacter sp. LHW66-3]|uniref:serine hydrolase n=1 Tax=Sphingosinithalassobacter sp. LHW66-3 TaxID=3424718 RepID=UPI003D6A3973
MLRTRLLAAAFAALTLTGAPAVAQDAPASPPQAPQAIAPSPALQARIDELPAILSGGGDYEAFFHPAFVAQVPKAQFDQMTAQMRAGADAPPEIADVEARDPNQAVITVAFANTTATLQIAVDPAEPHQVTGLRVTGFQAREASLGEVFDAIEALPGRTGYAAARLGDGAPQMLHAEDADTPFGVGSAFKLWILAELVRATNAGERQWDDVVTLDGSALPGGAYFAAPAGTEVTLRELAGRMISVSDNSATDILLHHLGRERVEAMLPVVGVAPEQVAMNRPLLGTLEFFKLKGIEDGALGRQWIGSDHAERRALLAGEVAAAPITAIRPDLFQDGVPVMIDAIEFFASPADLVRTMDWLRRNTEANSVARDILSQNPGVSPGIAQQWRYVGYKGGSEPGVINMTLLLQAQSGEWYAFSGSWNDPEAAVDNGRFAGLVSRMAELAAAALPQQSAGQ